MVPAMGLNARFFCFEGLDGSGKTTQIEKLAAHLCERGLRVVRVREPGGTAISDAIRSILLSPSHKTLRPRTELLLFSAARAQLMSEVIEPALESGAVVLADRFAWSTLAYQGYGRGIAHAEIESLSRIACGGIWPTLTFLLDLPVNRLAERLHGAGRGRDRMESENEAFFERVRQGYLDIARSRSEEFLVLDAQGEPDMLTRRITLETEKRLDLI